MILDWSLKSWLALIVCLLIASFIFKIFSASRSPLHALPGPERASLLIGNVAEAALFSSSERNYVEEWMDSYGGVVRVYGLMGSQPELCVSDPEFLHRAYITDNDSWRKPHMLDGFYALFFGPCVLAAHGDDHKRQRKMLNPMFTPANTRDMTASMYEVAHKLSRKISGVITSSGTGSGVIDIMKLSSSTALDMVGSAGLGHNFDALGMETEYARVVKLFAPTLAGVQLTIPFLKELSYLGPYSFRSWFMDTFCPFLGGFGRSVITFRHMIQTMHDTARAVYRDRQTSIANEEEPTQFSKKDVLSNLVRATSKDSSTVLEEPEALAHINTLVFAGHETTSSAIAHLLDIISIQQDLQARLRAEILKARADSGMGGDLSYDTIMGLPLLDAVVRETLRLYAPVPMITRESERDMVVPFSFPVRSADGRTEITEIFVPKNTRIHVSIAGINRSRAIWGEDAREFKPERWLRAEGPADPASASAFARIPSVFSSVMSFSAGPAGCLGWRMAVLEIKMIVVVLLQRFAFEKKTDLGITWMYGATLFPVVIGEEDAGPRLPIVVSEVSF